MELAFPGELGIPKASVRTTDRRRELKGGPEMMTARATIGEWSRFRVRPPGAFTSAAKDADEARAGRGAVVLAGVANARRRRRAAAARPSCIWPPSVFVQSLPNSL